ncbi:SDR family oxidoreductase [Curtobacterium sp. TC1]|nr:SDR family oxidoreductase [Curtobacterium sp. TC1]
MRRRSSWGASGVPGPSASPLSRPECVGQEPTAPAWCGPVTINTVLGGPTYSDGVATTVEAIAEAQALPVEAMRATIIGQNRTSLLERFIDPAETAALVTYLASPLSSATNGAAIRVDGGVLTGLL